nr:ribonuclease H-like domain-containing protein [Tanacetum cinerariifolium]
MILYIDEVEETIGTYGYLKFQLDSIDTESKLGSDGDIVLDPTVYRSLADLVAYSNADWAGCPTTRSAEDEYRGVANVVAETCWLCNLLRELHTPLTSPT